MSFPHFQHDDDGDDDDQNTDDDDAQDVPKVYKLTLVKKKSWGNGTRTITRRIPCDRVEHTDHMVRFIDGDDDDIAAYQAELVKGYRRVI